MKAALGTLVVACGLLAMPADAAAQGDRWTPWVGCWALVTENVREGEGSARAAALSPVDAPAVDESTVPRTCVTRTGEGVTMVTTVPEQPPITQVLVTGASRDIEDGSCRGTERTEWSPSGARLFARAEVTCDGKPRTITGMGLITPGGQWLDIRTFTIDGRDATRVSRYRRVAGVVVQGTPLKVDEIKDAVTRVAPSVVEAAIAETRPQFAVNRKLLLELSDASVPAPVIDMMIAVSYPQEFVVESGPAPRDRAYGSPSYRSSVYDPFFDFGYFPSYYYSPFAYGYIGRYDPFLFPPYWSGRPGGGGGGIGSGDDTPMRGTGRAVNGQGYTRIRPADSDAPRRAVPNPNTGGNNGTITSNSGGSSTSSAPAPAADSSSGGGGGGSASPAGYSNGGDGGGGRTAQPR